MPPFMRPPLLLCTLCTDLILSFQKACCSTAAESSKIAHRSNLCPSVGFPIWDGLVEKIKESNELEEEAHAMSLEKWSPNPLDWAALLVKHFERELSIQV